METLIKCWKCGHLPNDLGPSGTCEATVKTDGLDMPCYCVCEYVHRLDQPPPSEFGHIHSTAETCGEPCPMASTERKAARTGTLGEVIDRRTQVYGDPEQTFVRIAAMWSALIDHEIQPWEVPLMMVAMKMIRTQVMPDYSDNSDDIDGYMDIFRTMIGPEMIHARSVEEFIKTKWGA